MNATKNILYQECAVFDWTNKESVTVYKYGYEARSNKDYVFVEVRQYLPDDGKAEAIIESTAMVDGTVAVHSVKVIAEPGAYANDAALIRQGIKSFDDLIDAHPSAHAKSVKEYKDGEVDDDLPF